LLYAYKTSFVVDGERIFSLWDDAMISMRYARNFARGDGLVWNAGERVQGFSNIGVTLVMALVHLLPLSPAKTPLVIQIVSAGVLVAIAERTSRLASLLSLNPAAGLAAALAVSFFAPLGIWAMQGADSGFITLALVCASVEAARALESGEPERGGGEPHVERVNRTFVALAAGVLVRLDFVPTYLLFFGVLLWHLPDRRKTLLRGIVPLLLVLGGISLIGVVYYGDPLPNTYYLKATGLPRGQMLAAGRWQLFGPAFGIVRGRSWIAVAMFAAGALVGVRRPVVRLLTAVVVIDAGYFVLIGGDWVTVHASRLLVQAGPLLIVVVVSGAVAIVRWAERTSRDIGRWTTGIAALHVPILLISLNQRESLKEWWTPGAVTFLRGDNERSVRVARYLAQYSDPEARIGVFWAGVLPYHCDRPMLDLLGRADRHIAKTRGVPAEYYWPGHAKRDWDYVLRERKPDILLAAPDEMNQRPDYVTAYCHPEGSYWLALRRDAVSKWHHPQAHIGCATVATTLGLSGPADVQHD
jgi:hypothetical protein